MEEGEENPFSNVEVGFEEKEEKKSKKAERREKNVSEAQIPPSGVFELFVKPKRPSSPFNDTLSRHLFVAKGGKAANVSRGELFEVFSHFGNLSMVTSCEEKTHAFVSFENVEDAAKAQKILNGRHCKQLNRHLIVSFALYKGDKDYVVGESPLPVDTQVSKDVRVPGFVLLEGFLSESEEKNLLEEIYKREWTGDEQIGMQRRVQHYGYDFDYKTRNIDVTQKSGELPHFCSPFFQKLSHLLPNTPDQLTVNEYLPGQGIRRHVDTHSAFEDGIASLSLGAATVLELRHPLEENKRKYVHLPPRSLFILTGEARYLWSHHIPARKTDMVEGKVTERSAIRVSLTFRKVRGKLCECKWPLTCDSSPLALTAEAEEDPKVLSYEQSSAQPTLLEKVHVHKFYEEVAEHFSDTRHTPWPSVLKFLSELPKYSLVGDIGCGNGRYQTAVPQNVYMGCDRGIKFSEMCVQNKLNVCAADILDLPYKSEAFDHVICIAVLHHLATPANRRRACEELLRIVKKGGRILVFVWALEQEKDSKRKFDKQDVFVSWNLPSKYTQSQQQIHASASHVEEKPKEEVKKEPKKGEKKKEKKEDKPMVFQRYCHVYKQGEVEELFLQFPNTKVLSSWFEASNWCVIVEKTG